jgi:Ca2+-binding RTX toxin-like protein
MSKDLTSSFQLGAGTTLNFVNGWGLSPASLTPSRIDLDIAGTISVGTDNNADSTALMTGAVAYQSELTQGSRLTIEASGQLIVKSGWPDGFGYGVYGVGWAPDISNAGLIDVSAPRGVAGVYGIFTAAPNTPTIFNSGTIRVVALEGFSKGVFIGRGGDFLNTGDISATGASDQIRGVELRYSGVDGTFLNKGTITATQLDPAFGLATGVMFDWHTTFENQGTITGGYALRLPGGSGHVSGFTYQFINSGRMNGVVDLGGKSSVPGREVLHNSGTIHGDVNFGPEGDVLDGTSGTLVGVVHGNKGDDQLFGGAGAATIFGDAGDDTISGGAAASSVVDGGAGVDTLSFVGATTGVILDVGAQTVSTGETFSNFERYQGGDLADKFAGSGNSDTLDGGAGSDTINGNAGDDLITDSSGSNYLRGDDGNDSISGGRDFDDINGNQGADTAHGNDGDDWVVGGKDNDLLFGGAGHDIVYGNMGDDTIAGDAGVDWVRGGQGDDSVSGGAGDDWLWGDRGDDTISGGAGADIFHSFSGAGIDRITDFSLAEGDKVQLDPGTTYTIRQSGADTVIDLGGGDQVVLVGVQASTLTASSVFVG